MFLSLEIVLFVSMEKLQLWAGPRSPAVQQAGMSGSLGRACSWSEHLDALMKKAKVVVFLWVFQSSPSAASAMHCCRSCDCSAYNVLDHPQLR